MSILDFLLKIIYQIICFFISLSQFKWDKCTFCPEDTCAYDQSREFIIPYSSELNLNSSCDDIKDYIISELEKKNSQVFGLSSGDISSLTENIKNDLIFILENSSSLIEDENGSLKPGIRFKFCCPTEEHCLL